MNNLSLTRKFALVSLNGERVKNTTAFNSLKERCMVTSLLLDLIVNKKMLTAKEYDCSACDSAAELNESEKAFYNVWKEKGSNDDTLSDLVKQFLDMPKKLMNIFCENLIEEMQAEQLIEIVPSLLECDLYYQTSGVKIREYRSVSSQYQNGSGIAAKIPALEKREAIFIQTEKMFSDSWERTDDVKRILESNGHICKVKTVGAVSLMEIDDVLYEVVPDAVRVRTINIHGVRLRRHVM
ncbi:hypothetical protein [Lacrimispora sp.]|uniref:hypothetical protein n=1 Tax=Lacrimispora sp. TaxID=2719234 RepID=UPI0029E47356|nr:hypothetical protein [Lacrimispora sp.]